MLTIEIITKGLKDVPAAFTKAELAALNRTARSARTELSRQVRARYNVKAREIKRGMRVTSATIDNQTASIRTSGRPIPLVVFAARQAPQGVSFIIRKSDGRKLLAHTFLAKMPSGKIGVFMRAGKSRLPIKTQFGPSLPQMAGEDEIQNALNGFIAEKLPAELDHQLEFYLGRAIG